MRPVIALALVLAAVWAGDLASGKAVVAVELPTQPLIRVGLVVRQPRVEIAATGTVAIEDVITGSRHQVEGGRWVVSAGAEGLEVSGLGAFGDVVRFIPSQGGTLSVGRRAYRGRFLIRRDPKGLLTLINEVGLEEYLYGVLKMEVSPMWPMEALKTQAVAARTLALYLILQGRYKDEGYDVRDTVESQVYGGINHEDPTTTEAVEATRGLVLTFQGRPINAIYHADSGGHTEDSERVWGTFYPYLRGIPDPYSGGSPYSQWSFRLPLQEIEARLRKAGKGMREVRAIEPMEYSPSGRVMRVRVVTDQGVEEISGEQLRRALGYDVLRSTMFTVVLQQGGRAVEFQGRGWGHGVGLPQWSALNQAKAGRTFREILAFYYRGATLEPWSGNN